ncbi:YraN family protein [Chloroflexota bacterium]
MEGIIAEHDNYLVFVEVCTKKSLAFGTPEESITQVKKGKLILTAQTYMQSITTCLITGV